MHCEWFEVNFFFGVFQFIKSPPSFWLCVVIYECCMHGVRLRWEMEDYATEPSSMEANKINIFINVQVSSRSFLSRASLCGCLIYVRSSNLHSHHYYNRQWQQHHHLSLLMRAIATFAHCLQLLTRKRRSSHFHSTFVPTTFSEQSKDTIPLRWKWIKDHLRAVIIFIFVFRCQCSVRADVLEWNEGYMK